MKELLEELKFLPNIAPGITKEVLATKMPRLARCIEFLQLVTGVQLQFAHYLALGKAIVRGCIAIAEKISSEKMSAPSSFAETAYLLDAIVFRCKY